MGFSRQEYWSPGKNTGVGCHALLQAIFPTQGSNPDLPHGKWILYHLSLWGSPRILEWVAYPFSRGASWSRNWTRVSCIVGRFLPAELPGKPRECAICSQIIMIFLMALYFVILFIFGCAGACCCMQIFCCCSEWGLLSNCDVRASHWSGFSYCGAWALGCMGFSSCLMICGIFLDQGLNLCPHWQADF